MFIYESCFILSPRLTDDEIDELTEKLKGLLTSGGAEIIETSRWGKRKLAYPINKEREGFYYIFFYKLDNPGDTLTNLQRSCKFDENVFRLMTTKIPLKKKGEEIKPLVPAPGHLADFSMELRPQVSRRRHDGPRGPRPTDAPAPRPAPARPPEASATATAEAATETPSAPAETAPATTEAATETPPTPAESAPETPAADPPPKTSSEAE